MAKKMITQVIDWLKDVKGAASGDALVSDTAMQFEWAIKGLTRVDARDSQNQKPRKKAKRKAAR